jgi:hypothetical protein
MAQSVTDKAESLDDKGDAQQRGAESNKDANDKSPLHERKIKVKCVYYFLKHLYSPSDYLLNLSVTVRASCFVDELGLHPEENAVAYMKDMAGITKGSFDIVAYHYDCDSFLVKAFDKGIHFFLGDGVKGRNRLVQKEHFLRGA